MLARGAVIIRKDNMIGLEFNIKNHFKTFYRRTFQYATPPLR